VVGAQRRVAGYRPKTFARYLRLCCRVAGVHDEIEFEDALGIASFLVQTGKVPHPAAWCENLVIRRQDEINERALEALF
jgi:hypothetical protein